MDDGLQLDVAQTLNELGGGLDVLEGDDGVLAQGSVQQIEGLASGLVVVETDELNDASGEMPDLGVVVVVVVVVLLRGERQEVLGLRDRCDDGLDALLDGEDPAADASERS